VSIELWAVRLERALTAEEMDTLVCLLPDFRRERLYRLRREEKRQEVLCAYLLLRKALWERYGWSEWPEFAFLDGGKPYFPDKSEVQFSISHTGGAVAAVVSGDAVGVDIEKIRPLRQSTVRNLDGQYTQQDFFRSWVRKEALAKCRGSGVAGMLRTEPQVQPREHYFELELFPGYVAGIAAQREKSDIMVRIVSMEDIIKCG